MRELKFRVWDNENNKYYEPTYMAYDNKLEELFLMQCGQICMRKIDGIYGQSNFPNRFIVEQFTGLRDKKGVEIYENDVVRIELGAVTMDGEIVWNEEKVRYVFVESDTERFGIDKTDIFEVIGNTHEGVRNDGRD